MSKQNYLLEHFLDPSHGDTAPSLMAHPNPDRLAFGYYGKPHEFPDFWALHLLKAVQEAPENRELFETHGIRKDARVAPEGKMMSFQQLFWAATVVKGEKDPLHLVHEWSAKREALYLQLIDIPQLVAEFKRRRVEKDPNNPQRMYIDSVPTLRLANACESTCHALYSTAEVAASFANKVSNGAIPSSFNALRKKVRDGKADKELTDTLADVQWYEKVREVRTEWTHHSSIFIGEQTNREPIFVVRSYRRQSDKEHFKEKRQYAVSEIVHWTTNAIKLLDAFAAYLLKKYVLPSFDLDAQLCAAKREADGFPVLLGDGRIDVEFITIREYLTKLGVEVPSKTAGP